MPNFIIMKKVNFPKTADQRKIRSFKNLYKKTTQMLHEVTQFYNSSLLRFIYFKNAAIIEI